MSIYECFAHVDDVNAFTRRLNLPLCSAIGILESLWQYGDLAGLSNPEIAEIAGCDSIDPNALVNALVETNWLFREVDGGRYCRDHWRDPDRHAAFLRLLNDDKESAGTL